MDIKSRVKSIKEKLTELNYEVKHTHCQEVLAVALGYRNFHALRADKEPSSLTKALDVILPENPLVFITKMGASNISERYENLCPAMKVTLSYEDYQNILKTKAILEQGLISAADLTMGAKTEFVNISVTSTNQDDPYWGYASPLSLKDSQVEFEEITDETEQPYLYITKHEVYIKTEISYESQVITYTSEPLLFSALEAIYNEGK